MSTASTVGVDPGALSLRMAVLEPVVQDDAMGGGIRTFTQRRSLWAAFSPQMPGLRSVQPVRDGLAVGAVLTRIGLAPPPGWRLSWTSLGAVRTVDVIAVERGTGAYPFDRCDVREVTS